MDNLFAGIDQSYSSSGLVVIDSAKNIRHFEAVGSSKEQDPYWRSWTISCYILEAMKKFSPVMITIEGLAFGMRGDATRDLAGLQFVIIDKLRYENSFNVNIVSPLSLKKFATDNGKAKKDEMFDSLPDNAKETFLTGRWKKTTGLYDITDAYWLARHSLNYYNKTDAKSALEN